MIQLTYKHILALAVLVAVVAFIVLIAQQPRGAFGSVRAGDEYLSTTTRNFAGVALPNLSVLKASYGAFRGVTITGAGAGQMNFYDATTSNVSLRTGQKASSTILIATFPASAAANDYSFDAQFTDGLMYEIIGTAPTSTINWR